MASSHLTTDLETISAKLERDQREAYQWLGREPPGQSDESINDFSEYIKTNPDLAAGAFDKNPSKAEQEYAAQLKVVDLTTPPSRPILSRRVAELSNACDKLGYGEQLKAICFGSLPAGGLDASCFKLNSAYGVVIPEGFFHLTNLLTKIVILLQPITPTAEGPVFLPSASFDQLSLQRHPYVVFRQRDLLEAFFLFGDPMASLPYRHALPYQDRFAYLLVGTELFVLAHEVAHILLGHLDGEHPNAMPAQEVAADQLALKIVAEYFRQTTDLAAVRATGCGMLFLSMVKLWETGLERITGDSEIARSHTHPVFDARLRAFIESAAEVLPKGEKAPGWYLFTHNAIQMATRMMADDAFASVKAKAGGIAGLSTRVLPWSHRGAGHIDGYTDALWWSKIAALVASQDQAERRIGLWFLCENLPESAEGLYEGLMNDDVDTQRLCRDALVAIEPMYRSYLPRLMVRFHEMTAASQLEEYILTLASYIGAMAKAELGEDSLAAGPLSPQFDVGTR